MHQLIKNLDILTGTSTKHIITKATITNNNKGITEPIWVCMQWLQDMGASITKIIIRVCHKLTQEFKFNSYMQQIKAKYPKDKINIYYSWVLNTRGLNSWGWEIS